MLLSSVIILIIEVFLYLPFPSLSVVQPQVLRLLDLGLYVPLLQNRSLSASIQKHPQNRATPNTFSNIISIDRTCEA